MLTGIIIGLILVTASSLIGEIRVAKEIREIANLNEAISIKDKALEEKDEQIKKLGQTGFDLVNSTKELVHDYHIIAKLLEEEIGLEEANRRYNERKNNTPNDLNDLLKEIMESGKNDE